MKVVGDVVGDVEGCFGSGSEVVWEEFWSLVRWFGRSFDHWFARSVVRSFARRRNYIRKPLRELAHNSR